MSQVQSQIEVVKGPEHEVKVYVSMPDGPGRYPGLIVIHEIWGLVPHIIDVADRYAGQGYAVIAPDLMGSDPQLAPYFSAENVKDVRQFMQTLAPGRMRDQSYLQQELAKLPEDRRGAIGRWFALAFGGGLPYERFEKELVAVVEDCVQRGPVKKDRIGSVGFCFGGGMSARLACTGKTQACVVFYGQNPDPIERVEKINCPFLGIYGAEDVGLTATLDKLVGAMAMYRKDFEMKIYPGAPHAFFNDTNPHMYRDAAAKDAWERSLRFLNRALKPNLPVIG